MSSKRNITLLIIALTMTFAMWMVPQTISAQSTTKRLLALSTWNTSPTRTQSVGKYCAGITRSDLITSDQKSTSQGYKDQLAAQFKVNGNTLFNKLSNKQTDSAIEDIKADSTAFGLFIGFFVLGLVMLLFSWSFLICCCCCPGCCPSKCCQKNDNQQYTKCQLYWPSVFLILLLLVVVITTAIGLAKAATFKKGITNFTCAASMMFDDIVNGNVTSDGTNFFIGVNQLAVQLNNIDTNFATINTNMISLRDNLATVVTSSQTARDNTRLVPKNFAGDGNAVFQYTTGFDATYNSANPKIDSRYPTILGSSGNGGVIGSLYTALNGLYTTLNNVKTNSANFVTNGGTFRTAIAGIITTLNSFKDNLNSLDSQLKSALSLFDGTKQMGSLAIQLFYGVALGLAVMALLGVIMMTFCDKYKCRYLMYFSCFILFFFALLGFFIAIIFSIFVPLIYWSCDWLSVSFSSSANFNTNMAGLVTDANTRSYISPCLRGGTGDLMAAVAPGQVATLNNLRDSLKNTSSFNSSAQVTLLNAAVTQIDTLINGYTAGSIPDITDSTAISTLVSVANRNGITGCASLTPDSWVVSTANTTFTTCAVSGGTLITACTDKTTLQNGANCQGCLDTTLLSNAYYNALGRTTFKASLDARYGAADACSSPWRTYFGNVWDNYYFVKVSTSSHVDMTFPLIKSRWTTAKGNINTVTGTDLPAVNTSMSAVTSSLSSTVDGITNPTYGLVAGLNCLIIGQDIETLISTICVSNFNTLYITRLVSGISSFAILFALCCIVCSGVRHYKHNERKDKISPNFMGGKNSFEDTDAAFRP